MTHRYILQYLAELCQSLKDTRLPDEKKIYFPNEQIPADAINENVFFEVFSGDDKPEFDTEITNVSTVTDDNGAPRIVVDGTVTNRSDDIYAFPDLSIVLYDENGAPLSRQKFMPSATLLDAGQSVNFSHTLSNAPMGVKRVTVELLNVTMGDKK